MAWARKPGHVGFGGVRAALGGSSDDALPLSIAEALRKARRMDFASLLGWAEASLATIGRNITDHRHTPRTGDHLRAALSDAAALYAVLQAAVEALPTPGHTPTPTADLGVASVRQG